MTMLATLLGRVFREELTLREHRTRLDRRIRAANKDAWARVPRLTTSQMRDVVVEKVIRETADTVSLYLRPEDSSPVHYRTGQFITCCLTIDGEEYRRAYSISDVPARGRLRITIRQVEGGVVSNHVQHRLREGDRFRMLGPSGDFVLAPDMDQCVFIAAGVGITPIRGLAEELVRRSPGHKATLIYACRTEQDIIFREELDALAAGHENLALHYVLSRQKKGWQGERGRLTAERLTTLLQDADTAQRAHYFVCGPQGFMDMAEATLRGMGVPAARLHSERFLSAHQVRKTLPDTPQTVHFVRSGKTVTAQPGETLLEAGLRAGVPLSYSCQVGGCGHCRVQVAEGEVVSDEPNCLSPEEYQQGYRLACLSHACSETRVDA